MSWLLSHASEIGAGALAIYGWWKRRHAKKATKRALTAEEKAAQLQSELDMVRSVGGTKAPWEMLSEQARSARTRAKPG